jgi:microsomal epoxide hydrolase
MGGYDIDRRSEDIAEVAARFERVVLVGWSLGALECLHYVHRHGDARVAGLVLVDSSVGEDPAPPPGASFIAAMRRDRERGMADFVHAMFRTPQPEQMLAQLTRGALRMELEASLSLLPRHLPREHWRDIARGFARPLLYAVTTQFAAQAQSLERHRPGTRIELFDRAGHALFVDEPARFNAMLAAFVDGILKT